MHPKLEPNDQHHLHFVTGKLAESAVRDVVDPLSKKYAFEYSVGVMPITVAALITPKWLIRKLQVPEQATHIVVPGFCETGISLLEQHFSLPVVLGPRDCRDIPELFGQAKRNVSLDQYDIEIIGEINHAPRYEIDELVAIATRMTTDGADVIDVGCDPAERDSNIAARITALVQSGFRVSVDTFDPWEAQAATAAGASLVLSVNSSNREQAVDWGTEVVVIPDSPTDLESLNETIEFLSRNNVAMRLDPILEPIGAGLAASLVRYASVRERYPELPMMMGIGNLTELTDVDSAGVNLLLLGICQELNIRSVLTTEVINWARSSVRECDHGRRLVHAAVRRGVPPKNFSDSLVMLRDRKLKSFSDESLSALAESIKDNNYRLFAQGGWNRDGLGGAGQDSLNGQIHIVSRQMHLVGSDPFQLFDQLLKQPISDNVDRGHAFYLGYEMAKASIALTLGKQYEQDRALNWGMLTVEEDLHRLERTSRHRDD